MTISEIETTLNDLQTRHATLDEATVSLLLSSANWEQSAINEALAVFRSSPLKAPLIQGNIDNKVSTGSGVQDLKVVSPLSTTQTSFKGDDREVSTSNTVSGGTNSLVQPPVAVVVPPPKVLTEEKESLVSAVNHISKEVEPPENLPLKPFVTTPNVVPFSEYKTNYESVKKDAGAVVEEHKEQTHEAEVIKKVRIERSRFDMEDEGLIMLTGSMLLIILLLLAYMYTNGRL